MASKSQVKASAKYDKANTIGIYIKLNRATDKKLIEKLNKVKKQSYIKSLILKDIEATD